MYFQYSDTSNIKDDIVPENFKIGKIFKQVTFLINACYKYSVTNVIDCKWDWPDWIDVFFFSLNIEC